MKNDLASYASIIEQLSIGVLVFNQADVLVYMNNKAQELLDTSERKALGIKASVLFSSEFFDIEKDFNRAGESATAIIERGVATRFLESTEKNMNLSISPLVLGEEEENYMLVEITNVDHYLQISQEAELLSQNEMATSMLRGLAHEIKNPLGGLRGAAQLLSKELDSSLLDYTEVIIEEADRLTGLVDRMLGSSEVPEHQKINIHVILERVRQLVQAEVNSKISLKADYDPSIPDINGDKDQLIQAVLNVVRNAVQAVHGKGDVILKTRILRGFTMGEVKHKLAVKIDVIDNGPGIPAGMRTKIFYPMVTGRAEGTGLGLSIAQTNVQRHNGIIEVTSKPGCTIFSIILPLGN